MQKMLETEYRIASMFFQWLTSQLVYLVYIRTVQFNEINISIDHLGQEDYFLKSGIELLKVLSTILLHSHAKQVCNIICYSMGLYGLLKILKPFYKAHFFYLLVYKLLPWNTISLHKELKFPCGMFWVLFSVSSLYVYLSFSPMHGLQNYIKVCNWVFDKACVFNRSMSPSSIA